MAGSDTFNGVITKGVGGIYTVRFSNEGILSYAQCAARGQFRLKGIKPAIGDRVTIMPSGDPDVEYVIPISKTGRASLRDLLLLISR